MNDNIMQSLKQPLERISPNHALPTKADVVIIGAGIAGCSAAWELTKKGLKVVLLEKGIVGCELCRRHASRILALLMHTDCAEHAVVHDDHDEWCPELDRRRKFLRVHHETAVAREADDLPFRIPDLCRDRRWKSVSHGTVGRCEFRRRVAITVEAMDPDCVIACTVRDHGIVGQNLIQVSDEQITTRAGSFSAIKIRMTGVWSPQSGAGGGPMEETLWYAPATKRIVREEFQGRMAGKGVPATTATELVRYAVKP